jgi:hypothetical protein
MVAAFIAHGQLFVTFVRPIAPALIRTFRVSLSCPRLHPRRAGWPRLTVTASVATRKPLVFRQSMNTDKEIWAT